MPAVPEDIAVRLARLPRRATFVYWAALRRCKMERSATVVIPTEFLAKFGIKPPDKCRALSDLERAGLIRVQRCGRHNPAVTVIDLEESP
jgi:hypothetical protein